MEKANTPLTVETKIKTIVFLIGGLFFIWLFFFNGCSKEDEPKNYSNYDALSSSRQFVEQKLKSPASAEFCSDISGVKKIDSTTFIVNSCVDSQNGFGAMIRSNYSCTIIYDKTPGMVNCENLIIE